MGKGGINGLTSQGRVMGPGAARESASQGQTGVREARSGAEELKEASRERRAEQVTSTSREGGSREVDGASRGGGAKRVRDDSR